MIIDCNASLNPCFSCFITHFITFRALHDQAPEYISELIYYLRYSPGLDQHFKVTSVTETWLRQSVIYFFLCRPKIIDPLAWGIYWLSLLLWHFKDHSFKKYHFPFIFFLCLLVIFCLNLIFYLVFCGRIVLNLFQLWYWVFTVLGFKNTWKVWKVL